MILQKAVDPLFADKGAGTFIVQQCIKIAEQCGYKSLRLDVVPGNNPAEHLYKKLGFEFAGRKDLRRNIYKIPVFDLFELIFSKVEIEGTVFRLKTFASVV